VLDADAGRRGALRGGAHRLVVLLVRKVHGARAAYGLYCKDLELTLSRQGEGYLGLITLDIARG
jgi:hypothetical protein